MTIFTKYIAHLNLEELVYDLISKLISLILLFIIFEISKRVLNYVFEKAVTQSINIAKQNPARQKTIIKLSHNIMNYVLYFFIFYWVLSILGIPVSSLMAGAGIAGVAIGLGAQGFLTDMVNGFFILLENQFDVGDSVTLGTISGTIVNVGIRTTQVQDFDGTLHYIPNRNITVVSNKSRGNMRAQIDLALFADTNLQIVNETIESVNQEQLSHYPEIIGQPKIVGPKILTSGQLVFRIDIFVKNGMQYKVYADFYRFYQEALLAQDINLPTVSATIIPEK